MAYVPKNFGSPIRPFSNPTSDEQQYIDLYNKAIYSSEDAYKNFRSDLYIRPEIQQQQINAERQRRANVQLNSLRLLSNTAFGGIAGLNNEYANKKSLDLYNRINAAQTDEQLNQVYKEVEEIAEIGKNRRPFTSFLDSPLSFYANITRPTEAKKAYKDIESNYDNLSDQDKQFASIHISPSGLFENAVQTINEKRFLNESNKYKQQVPDFFKKLDTALKDQNNTNAFNEFLTYKFDNDRKTRGNVLFRDDFYDEGREQIQQIEAGGKKAIFNPTTSDEKLFKYDLEKATLTTLQKSLADEISKIGSLSEEELTPELKNEKKTLLSNLDKLENRIKNLNKVYGLSDNVLFDDSADRSGFFRGLVGTIVPLGNLMRSNEFDKIAKVNAVYQPEVIKYDKDGKPVMSNQFTYVKKDGSIGFNWGSIPELGGAMVGIILPTVATGNFVSGLTAGLATGAVGSTVAAGARAAQTGYTALNSYKGLRLADRISTFASVTMNTTPMMIEEEKRWGGDYQSRGLAKATVEGLTEAIGFPDIGALRARPFTITLGAASKKIASAELKVGDKLRLGLSASYEFGKAAVKQNIVEAFEEEMSLLGNAILEHSVFDQSMFDKYGREKTKFTPDAVYDTFVDSFLGGIIYSGGTNIVSARKTLGNDNLYNQSNWQAVNNPELFKAKLLDLKDKGKISDDEFTQGLARLSDLQTIFKANITTISKLKDLRTLLDDKDKQYSIFTTAVKQNDLISIDFNALTEEDREALGKLKIQKILGDKGRARIAQLREEIAVLENKEDLTEEEKQQVTEKTFQYATLSKMNRGQVNRQDLSKSDLDMLASMGIIPNVDLTFTEEDYIKEVNSISKEILKTKSQVDKYVNLSETDKQKIIEDLFTERIEALQKIDSAVEVVESIENLRKDLEYLKLKNEGNSFDIEQRERLYDAYGERFKQLTERGEDGFTELERRFEQEGYYEKIKDPNNTYDILKDLEYIESNEEFFDKGFYQAARSNLINTLTNNIAAIAEATPEERVKILTEFYDKIASFSPLSLYDLERTNNYFTLTRSKTDEEGNNIGEEIIASSNFTKEEMEAARENVIEKRAKRNSERIAKGQKPYDAQEEELESEVETEEETLSEDEKDEVNSDLNEILKDSKKEEDQESKTSGDEEVNSKLYEDAKFFYEKNKDKTPAQLAEVARNIIRRAFNYNRDPNSPYGILANYSDAFFNGTLSFSDYEEQINQMMTQYPKKVDALSVHLIFLSLVNQSGKIKTVETDGVASTGVAPSTAPKTNNFVSDDEKSVQKRDQEIEVENSVRVKQLLSLASPLRTVGVELDADNMPSEDPADKRRVAQLKKMSSSEFPDTLKIALVNRQKFMKMYLEKKYPNKSQEEINNDLTVINEFFENSEEGAPLPEEVVKLIGETLFSTKGRKTKGQVPYWQSNKGKGFSTQPDVVVTLIDDKGKLYLFEDGFPLDLNTASVNEERKDKKIKWNVSSRILNQLKEEGITEDQILQAHGKTYDNLNKLKDEISKDNNKVFTVSNYNVSEGVFIRNTFTLGAALQADNNPEVANTKSDSFEIATRENQTLFEQRRNYELGRLYYNANGTPVKLSNERISKSEAEALADLIYSNTWPYEYFADPNEFRIYLFNLINDSSKDNRIYFKPNRAYDKGEDPEAFTTNVLYKKGKQLKQLSKQEFIDLVQTFYYKASKDYLKSNKSIPRFEKVEGEVKVNVQTYPEYLMSTHSFPIGTDGQISKNVNQLVYFTIPEITNTQPVTQSRPVVQAKQKAPETKSDQETDSEGFVIASKSSPFLKDSNKLSIQAFIGTRLATIEKLKKSGKGANTIEFFSKMTDAEFEKFIIGLPDIGFTHQASYGTDFKAINPDSIERQDDTVTLNLSENQFIQIEVEGTKLLIPISNQTDAIFNLRYQPEVEVIREKDNTAFKPKESDAVSVGVNSTAEIETNKKTVTYDPDMGEAEFDEDEEFEEPGDEDVLVGDSVEPEIVEDEKIEEQPTPTTTNTKADIERRRQEELNSEKSFEGNRTQAELLRLPGNYLKKGDYVQIKNVNISQDTTMPDYRTGKFKIQMISVNVDGKDGIVTLSDGNEVITPKISDLINAKYDEELAALEKASTPATDKKVESKSKSTKENRFKRMLANENTQAEAQEVVENCKKGRALGDLDKSKPKPSIRRNNK